MKSKMKLNMSGRTVTIQQNTTQNIVTVLVFNIYTYRIYTKQTYIRNPIPTINILMWEIIYSRASIGFTKSDPVNI